MDEGAAYSGARVGWKSGVIGTLAQKPADLLGFFRSRETCSEKIS